MSQYYCFFQYTYTVSQWGRGEYI